MKIAIIGPGIMDIPPKGWGAVEVLIEDYRAELTRLGHTVLVVNVPDRASIISTVNNWQPDFVHCQYDEFIDVFGQIDCPRRAITSHFGYIDQIWRFPHYRETIHRKIVADNKTLIFALSGSIADVYVSDGVDPGRIRIIPNGVNVAAFSWRAAPALPDRSIYLAKVDFRKRQGIFQDYGLGVDFIGNLAPELGRPGFDPSRADYLGEWTREKVFSHLTDYANLLLLSDGEAHPLVCLEAMAAGLGLVLSEFAGANLDLSKPFIDIIPERSIRDRELVKHIVSENRKKSIAQRREIADYAKEFDWTKTVKKYEAELLRICSTQVAVSSVGSAAKRPKNIAIVTIATGQYFDLFFKELTDSIFERFSPGNNIRIFCFTDQDVRGSSNIRVVHISHSGWPFDTLLRFHMFCSIEDELKSYDNVFYIDVDMIVERQIDETILTDDFVGVIHPGFAGNENAATFEVDTSSEAFVPEELRKLYVQGCFFGGKSLPFRYLARLLRDRVERDLGAGEIAVWHDESHLNWFFTHHPVNALPPSYAHPEGWKYETAPVIVHRKKEHDQVRGLSLRGPSASSLLSPAGYQQAQEAFRALFFKSHEKCQRLEILVREGTREGIGLRTERDALRAERDGLMSERDGLRAERDGLRSERDGLRVERDGLISKRDRLGAERDGLHAERDGLRAERDGLRAERDGLRAERDAVQSERDALQTERDALRNLIDTWRRRLRWPLWVRRRLRELFSRRAS